MDSARATVCCFDLRTFNEGRAIDDPLAPGFALEAPELFKIGFVSALSECIEDGSPAAVRTAVRQPAPSARCFRR